MPCASSPERIPAAVEEFLRYDAPVPHSTFRYTIEPVEIAGVTIPAGAQVIVCLAAANRDATRFPDAERLDVDRADVHHLAFGHGIHFCLGAPLARMEGQLALGALLRRFPKLRLAVPFSALRWGHGDGLVLRGLTELPVIPGPARPAALSSGRVAVGDGREEAGTQEVEARHVVVGHAAIARLFDNVPDVGCPIRSHHEVVREKLTAFDRVLFGRDDLEGFVGCEPAPDDLRRGRRRVRLHDLTGQQRAHPYVRREDRVQAVEIPRDDRVEESARDRRSRRGRAPRP